MPRTRPKALEQIPQEKVQRVFETTNSQDCTCWTTLRAGCVAKSRKDSHINSIRPVEPPQTSLGKARELPVFHRVMVLLSEGSCGEY